VVESGLRAVHLRGRTVAYDPQTVGFCK